MHVSVIENGVKIDVALILSVKSLANGIEENLVSDWEEAVRIRLVNGASRRVGFRTRKSLRLRSLFIVNYLCSLRAAVAVIVG